MFNTTEELINKIRLGEDSFLELKAVYISGKKITGPDRKDLSDEIGAFGNTNGGVILLGVDDKTNNLREQIELEERFATKEPDVDFFIAR